jgi:hypothetical protein
MNAVTHGLTARTPLLPGEDSEEFRRFVWDIVEDLAPVGPVQAELASRAAVLMWKRRRISDAERLVIEELQNKYVWDVKPEEAETEEPQEGEEPQEEGDQEEGHREECGREEESREEDRDAGELDAGELDAGELDPVSPEGQARLRQYILADEFATKPNQLDRLEQYEHRISRQIDSTIRLLLRLQNRKDWREGSRGRQGQADRAEPEPRREAQPESPRTTAHRCAPSDTAQAPEPPPPAPAQNELPATVPDSPETAPGRAWTGPPGVN